jgi:hypothetical protein
MGPCVRPGPETTMMRKYSESMIRGGDADNGLAAAMFQQCLQVRLWSTSHSLCVCCHHQITQNTAGGLTSGTEASGREIPAC